MRRAGTPRTRLTVLLVVSGLLFVVVATRVGMLQTVQAGSYASAGEQQRLHSVKLPADRGVIFDRNGHELAISVAQSTVWADPLAIEDRAGTTAALANVLGLDATQTATLQAEIESDKEFVYIKRQVSDQMAADVAALKLKGVYLLNEPKRFRPAGDIGVSVIGTTNIDGEGSTGVEAKFDQILTGKPGELVRERDQKGRSIPTGRSKTVAPQPGDDMFLTIDRNLQYEAEQRVVQQVVALKAKGGMAMVMDTATGDVLAMVNVARDATTGQVSTTWANLAAVQTYEPGSVAKIIAASGAIEDGAVTPDTMVHIPGVIVVPSKPKDFKIYDAEGARPDIDLSVTNIIARSSNLGTVLLSRMIGPAQLDHYFRSFGFGAVSALDLPNEAAGILPPHQKWTASQTATVAYGQGVGVTAVQLAAAMNTIANGGAYVAPRLVKSTVDRQGAEAMTAPSETHRAIRADTAASMNNILQQVVSAGTAEGYACVPGYTVAGKTGTAYKAQTYYPGQTDGYVDAKGARHFFSSFAGFVPAEKPALTILVSIDEPQDTKEGSTHFGATAAAPVFAQIAEEALRTMNVPPTTSATTCAVKGR